MGSVVENLKDRREAADDLVVKAMVDEILENEGSLMREVYEPTLKHGADTVVFDDIVSDGLVPGKENSSEIGEQGEYESVCFTTSYPIALRYGELSEVNLRRSMDNQTVYEENLGSLEYPMVVENPASEVERLNVDQREDSAVRSVLGTDVNAETIPAIISHLEEPDEDEFPIFDGENHILSRAVSGEESSAEVVRAILGDSFVDSDTLLEHNVFEEISYDEVNADYIREVKASYSPVNETTNIYVPANQLGSFREEASEQDFEGSVHSIEARALLHEERMKDVYTDQGTVHYVHPADSGKHVSFFMTQGLDEHRGSADVVDVSSLRGEPVYGNNSV